MEGLHRRGSASGLVQGTQILLDHPDLRPHLRNEADGARRSGSPKGIVWSACRNRSGQEHSIGVAGLSFLLGLALRVVLGMEV
jgi:hypothetical protein